MKSLSRNSKLAALACAASLVFLPACRSDDSGGGGTNGTNATTADSQSNGSGSTTDTTASGGDSTPADTSPSSEGGAASQGITDTEIHIGGSFPQSGPLAFNNVIPAGAQAYFDYINAEGGINGRQIKFTVLDDAYDPSRTASNARQLVEQDKVFALMVYGGPAMAIRDYLEEKQVPQIAFAGNEPFSDTANYNYSRAIWPDVRLEFGLATRHILSENPDAKIGILGINNDFTISVEDGVKLGLGEEHADQLLPVERFESNATDLSGQINKLKADGADVLITTLGGPLAKGIEYVRQIGWDAPIYNYSNTTSKLTLIDTLSPEATASGLRTVRWFKDPADPTLADDEGIKHYREVIEKYGNGVSADDALTMNGYIAAEAVVAALTNMTADNGAGFVEAWDTMPPTPSDGLISGVDFEAKEGGRLISSYSVTEWDGEGWKVLDGPIDGLAEGIIN